MLAETDKIHMCIFFVLNVENTRNAFLKRAPFVILSKGNIDRSKNVLTETDKIHMCISSKEHQKCFLKTRAVRSCCSKGNVDRDKNVLAETDKIHMCIFFVLNVEEHQKCFLKTRAVRDSCSKGNIDRS